MRLCLVSDLPLCAVSGNTTGSEAEILSRHTTAWAQQGHDVYWLVSPAILREAAVQAVVAPPTDELLPATCRCVIPLEAYWYAGVRLLCVPSELWQRADLHTRLFTFLCLLHRARACSLFHAWSTLPVAYLAVYTARYLALPAVVSYRADTPIPGPQDAFLQAWTAQHAAAYVGPSPAAPLALDPERVHDIDPAQAGASQALLALYRRVGSAAP